MRVVTCGFTAVQIPVQGLKGRNLLDAAPQFSPKLNMLQPKGFTSTQVGIMSVCFPLTYPCLKSMTWIINCPTSIAAKIICSRFYRTSCLQSLLLHLLLLFPVQSKVLKWFIKPVYHACQSLLNRLLTKLFQFFLRFFHLHLSRAITFLFFHIHSCIMACFQQDKLYNVLESSQKILCGWN